MPFKYKYAMELYINKTVKYWSLLALNCFDFIIALTAYMQF